MATRQEKGDLAGLFRQRKQSHATKKLDKVDAATPRPSSSSSAAGNFSVKADISEESENILRQFDMDMRFGPCIGFARIERWKRAQRLGLNPPLEVKQILEQNNGASESLWDGRV